MLKVKLEKYLRLNKRLIIKTLVKNFQKKHLWLTHKHVRSSKMTAGHNITLLIFILSR